MADFLSDAASQLAVPPLGGGGIKSLGDFADVTKLAPPTALAGLTTDLKGMASKLNDLGANFKNPAAAADMFNKIEIPNVPNFNGAFSSLKDMMSQHALELDKLTLGTSGVPCTGPMGVPSVEDFMAPVTGGSEVAALTAGPISSVNILIGECYTELPGTVTFDFIESTSSTGSGATFNVIIEDGVYTTVTVANGGTGYTVDEEVVISGYGLGGTSPENDLTVVVTTVAPAPITAEALANLAASLDRAEGLFAAAGIDLDAPPPAPSLGSLISAATSLQKIGAETNGSGAADALKKMIPNVAPGETDPAKITNGIFGDAIKTAIAEGKNLKAMAAAGIKPPQFNPFEGLPAGGDANIASESAQKLLGG
jgi:hypothetical protein